MKRLLLIGPHAREPVQWAALERVCELNGLEGVAIAPPLADTEHEVHRQTTQVAAPPVGSHFVDLIDLPPGRRVRRAAGILRRLRAFAPGVVVLTAEPHDRVVLDALAALTLYRRPRVVAIAAENRVTLPAGPRGAVIRFLWRRIDVLAAAATVTAESFRDAGLPASVEASTVGLPVEDPPGGLPERLEGEGLRVLYLGRLVPEKGVEDLVEAVAACDGAELTLAGPGPLEERLRGGCAHALGLVTRDQAWEQLARADVLALLSRTEAGWSEQFGFVLAEAMAVGTPVLGSSSGAIPEVVGDAGLVVPERDPAAAAAALARLRDDEALRRQLGERGRARYAAAFSIDAYARKLAALTLPR